MASGVTRGGALQADGKTMRTEATMDVKHVADAVVHIAGLPHGVTVLNMNIMCVDVFHCFLTFCSQNKICSGQRTPGIACQLTDSVSLMLS